MKRALVLFWLCAPLGMAQVSSLPALPGVPQVPPDILPEVPGIGDLPYPVLTLGDLGADYEAFQQCYEEAEDPQICLDEFAASLDLGLEGLFPEPQPLPEEEKTNAYIDFVEHQEPGHWGVRLPSIHIGIYDEFLECQQSELGIAGCETSFILTTIYLPKSQAEPLQQEIDDAWETFKEAVADDVHEALNRDEPCVFAPTCTEFFTGAGVPLPNIPCAIERTITTLATSIPEHNLAYWQMVVEALATHFPNTLLWGTEALPFNVAISPVVDVSNPTQYFAAQTGDAREALYDLQALQAMGYPDVPLFALPGDKVVEVGGFYSIEAGKTQYQTATPYEYQEFGFSSFHEVWPEFVWEWFGYGGILDYKARIGLYCTLGPVKCYLCVLGIYVPWPFYAPANKGVYGFVTVPESQFIPRALGKPWTRPTY